MSSDDLVAAAGAVESRHRRGDWTEDGWQSNSVDGDECHGCGEDWPCSAERLRAAALAAKPEPDPLEAARKIAASVDRAFTTYRGDGRFCVHCGTSESAHECPGLAAKPEPGLDVEPELRVLGLTVAELRTAVAVADYHYPTWRTDNHALAARLSDEGAEG